MQSFPETPIVPVSVNELNLSGNLYGLLGGLAAEMSQLPTERTVERWIATEILHQVSRCKDALIDALHCALRLSQLGNLDDRSQEWIAEILRYTEEDQSQLDHVEDTLLRRCHPPLP